jgi:protein phosphatase
VRLHAWSQTDPGRKRDRNEDNHLVDLDLNLLAVADGMGGHQGGATASRMVLEIVQSEIRASKLDVGDLARVALADTGPQNRALRTTEPMEAWDPDGMRDTPPAGIILAPDAASTEPMFPVPPPLPPALNLLKIAARKAGHVIYDAARTDPLLHGMGTTLTCGMFDGDKLHLVHAGDSRCYLFRDGKLRQLTEDHSWIAEQLRAGAMTEDQARGSKFRHVITRSVGFERDVDVDTVSVAVEAGDCVVLCSDGMSNHVEAGELERIIASTWYRRLPDALVELANRRGGDDNITVIVGLFANHLPE